MKKQFIIIAVLVSVALTSYSYAEESITQVPFDSVGKSCWYDEPQYEYHCTWQGYIVPFTVEDLEEFKGVISEEVYQEEFDRLTAELNPVVIPQLTKDEKTIKHLELKLVDGTMTTPDAVLLQMLRELDECQQGLGNSSAIQTERTFTISQYGYLEVFNVDVSGQFGELSMAIEECKAQQVLEHQILTVAYLHFEEADRAGNFEHYESLQGVSAIPFDHFRNTNNTVDISVICDGHAYPQSYKDNMGCPPIVYDGYEYPEGNGFISYYSPIIEEYTFFMQDYGNKVATTHDKLVQESIAKPIVEEMLLDNLFAQNKLKSED